MHIWATASDYKMFVVKGDATASLLRYSLNKS
jgi:hypothetical protein